MRKLMYEIRNENDGYGVDLAPVDEFEQPDEDETPYAVVLQLFSPDENVVDLNGRVLLTAMAAASLADDLVDFLREAP